MIVRGIPPSPKRIRTNFDKLGIVLLLLTVLLGTASACGLKPRQERPMRIAFASDRGGNFDIYLMDRDGSGLTNLTGHPAEDLSPVFSSAANVFSFTSNRGPDETLPGAKKYIYRMNEHGEELAMLNAELPAATDRHQWSPSSERLAFEAGREDHLDLYLIDASRDGIRNLTDSPAIDQLAGWSPDGMDLLFTSQQDDRTAIYRLSISSGEMIRLTDPGHTSLFPDWSPDGEKIAFTSNRDGDIEIYVMDRDGQNPLRLTDSPGFDGFPRWSPQGDRIAFISTRDTSADIFVMGTDGSKPVNLTQTPGSHESIQGDFSWSPSGDHILFHSNRQGNPDIFVMNADGTQPVNLTSHPANDIQAIWVP